MIVSIHQPEYLPWLGFFDKMAKSDVFVILDNVQFQKNGFQNRNKIKTSRGWQWLTVPIIRKFPQSISEVKIDNTTKWWKKHLTALKVNYAKSEYLREYLPFFEEVYKKRWEFLADLNIFLIKKLAELFGIKTKIEISSSLNVVGSDTEHLVGICKKLNAKTYLSGEGGKKYIDVTLFEKEGIELRFREYEHPVYPQQHEKNGFISNMSAVDLLFNCGESAIDVIKSGGKII